MTVHLICKKCRTWDQWGQEGTCIVCGESAMFAERRDLEEGDKNKDV